MAHPRPLRSSTLAHAAAAILAVGGASAHAQSRPAPVSLDATVGGGWGAGGPEVRWRGGGALDATIAVRLRPSRRGAAVLAVAAAVQAPFWHNDACEIGDAGQCLEDFPGLASLGALAGWEGRGVRGRATWLSTRVLAGPALYVLGRDEPARASQRVFGAQGRLDLAMPAGSHLAFVTSLRAALLPSVDHDALLVSTLGIGLRLQ